MQKYGRHQHDREVDLNIRRSGMGQENTRLDGDEETQLWWSANCGRNMVTNGPSGTTASRQQEKALIFGKHWKALDITQHHVGSEGILTTRGGCRHGEYPQWGDLDERSPTFLQGMGLKGNRIRP